MASFSSPLVPQNPATFVYQAGVVSGILIGDYVNNSSQTPAGSSENMPSATLVATVPVSAVLELQSTTGALLIMRMTTAQRNALTTIANGMMIYNTSTTTFQFYQNGSWVSLSSGAGGVVGPGGGSTDNAVARWDGAGGNALQDSVVIIGDTGAVTGVLTIAADAGSAGAPSYAFTGDVDTGMWHSAANTIDFSTNGIKAVEITTTGLSVPVGSVTAGVSGTAGTVVSFPASGTGTLSLAAVNNTTFNTVISNAASGQAQVISIPDSGAGTANFIVSKTTGTQHITVGAFQVDAGVITSGFATGPTAGGFIAFPATTTNGSLRLTPVGNVGNFNTTISDVTGLGQSSVYTLPDPGNATARILVAATATPFTTGHLISASGTGGLTVDSGLVAANVLVSSLASPDTEANLVTFNVACGQAALATGGSVTLYASSGSKRYRIVSMYINSGGTNFSGGGGDRLGQVTDGSTVYSVVPATNMQTLINAGWGVSTPLPYPAAAAANTQTSAGASLVFKYSGGTTDYTAGSIVVTGLLERVA